MRILACDIFYLNRRHLLSANVDNVIRPAQHIDISRFVCIHHIACQKPAIFQGFLRECRAVPIPCHLHITLQGHAPMMFPVALYRIALFIQNAQPDALQRFSDRADLYRIRDDIIYIHEQCSAGL